MVMTGQWKPHHRDVRYKSKTVDRTECHTLTSNPPLRFIAFLSLANLRHTEVCWERSLYCYVEAAKPLRERKLHFKN